MSRIQFTWDTAHTTCRATAYDIHDKLLGQLVFEIPAATMQHIWGQRGATAKLRIEDLAERQLRAMLELRY